MSHELLQQYCRDRDARAARRLTEAYYPLVYSVCRHYLRQPDEVEDATQETFLKLFRRAEGISVDVQHWLSTAAASTSIDMIRRRNAERRRREELARLAPQRLAMQAVHDSIHQKLNAALTELDEDSRGLVLARFVEKTPLRMIAAQRSTSVATLSRRTSAAMKDLGKILRGMGVKSADDLTLAEHFGDPQYQQDVTDDRLTFAPDWQKLPSATVLNRPLQTSMTLMPNWQRPIRVGAVVGYAASRVTDVRGKNLIIDHQVHSLGYLDHAGIDLVGIVEPEYAEVGAVERTLRNYDLTGGLIDGTDELSLRTLDVILFGMNFQISPAIIRAIAGAVRSGVGLLKEWWLGVDQSADVGMWGSVEAAQLLLSATPVTSFHTKPCGVQLLATVCRSHELIPGLKSGDRVTVTGCGPVYVPLPDAKVLIQKNLVLSPQQHGIPGVGPIRPPVYVVGQIGQGRVVVAHGFRHGRMLRDMGMGGGYMNHVIGWLAEPKRES